MAVYQIYKFTFTRTNSQKLISTTTNKSTLDDSQKIFGKIAIDQIPFFRYKSDNTPIEIKNIKKAAHNDVIVLELDNEKHVNIYDGRKSENIPSHPGSYVIIDNRDGVALMAVEKSSAFSSTDSLCKIMQDKWNKQLDSYGLKIDIRAKMCDGEIWNLVEERKKQGDRINKVVFDFQTKIDETTPIDDPYSITSKVAGMQSIAALLEGGKTHLSVEAEKGKVLKFEQTIQDLAQLVNLCCRNGYGLGVHFNQYGIYRFGNQIKAIKDMTDERVDEFICEQKTIDNCGYSLITWLDEVRNMTESYKYENFIEPKKKRRPKNRA